MGVLKISWNQHLGKQNSDGEPTQILLGEPQVIFPYLDFSFGDVYRDFTMGVIAIFHHHLG